MTTITDAGDATPADKPVALVTGANKGIGLAVARQFGRLGHRVWLGCRDPGRGERAAAELREQGLDATALLLDVADGNGVRAAFELMSREAPALDILVNNAGISRGVPTTRASEEAIDDVRAMFETNTLGPLLVTQAFLPLLRRAKAAQVVMMSSGLGSIAETSDPAASYWNVGAAGYSASKAALNMLTVKLAKDLAADGIRINAADPGYTATDLNGNSGYRDVEQAAAIAVRLATGGPLGPTGGLFHDGHAAQHRWRW